MTERIYHQPGCQGNDRSSGLPTVFFLYGPV